MGNASSSSKGTSLAAVAEMMLLTKPQVMDIRETCAAMASKDGQIRRKLFHIAVAKAGVQGHLEADILDLLFTMWDENCDNRVFYLDFVVGIAPLACRYENMNSALKFILQVMDHKESGKIDSSELMSILRGKSVIELVYLLWLSLLPLANNLSCINRPSSRLSSSHHPILSFFSLFAHCRRQ